MTLSAAQKNETLRQLPAEWADFRGTSYDANGTPGGTAGSNNAVVSIQMPVDADASTLYWSNAIGSGIDSGSTGCPLLVDGVLIVCAGDMICRVDPVSGEILTKAKMDRASSFSITPPAYANGMVFVGLSDGTIQAFNAETLQSLWIYHDPLEGQPNSPITVCGDYLYTGFWRSEESPANFVCLSITDEDPARTDEEKTACWYWTTPGGYYWAGAYACEDYVLVGTDDGADGSKSMTGNLLMLDAKTGRLLDKWDGLGGGASDPDLTAMALQALARYRSRADVSAAVEAGLSCLSQMQEENGAFSSWGTESSESVSQVLTALTELGLSLDDARFVKNGQTLEDVLLRFAQDDGSFAHTPEDGGNLLATTQAFYALTALQRARDGKPTLYDMSDVTP